ncbi:hypothetical protein [Burkholderia sp. b14]|uniref:hypothetical protein n=1 Tax=Burkholderia sp. b14 TaxID=1761775 RepID=UPI003369C0C8
MNRVRMLGADVPLATLFATPRWPRLPRCSTPTGNKAPRCGPRSRRSHVTAVCRYRSRSSGCGSSRSSMGSVSRIIFRWRYMCAGHLIGRMATGIGCVVRAS